MANLSTQYMGLSLPNPIIVSSCSLVMNEEGVRRCADAGAGAVVLKSLFEEQIQSEIRDMEEQMGPPWHPEMVEYVERMGMELGPREYLELIEKAKRATSIPVIASLNCVSPKQWVDYARQIADAGADALELNISMMPRDPARSSEEIESLYTDILSAVKDQVEIPVAMKIGPYFTSMARIASELSARGVSALVLFNRFYQLDIDIEKLELTPGYRFSSPEELHLPLRWIALLAGNVECDLSASTGVHDGTDAIKLLLAGADAVQVCSTLYMNGIAQIGRILETLESWMEKHGVETIGQIRGKMSQVESDQPESYERLQYIRALVGIE